MMMKKKQKKKSGPDDGGPKGGASDGGVVIRVKGSTPAVLTALGLLERRCSSALLQRVDPGSENPWTRATEPPSVGSTPVLLPVAGWKQEGEGSVDTGYRGSTHTPVTLPDPQLMPDDPSFASEEVTETGASRNTTDRTLQELVAYDSETGTMTSQQPSLCDHVAVEEEEPSSASQDTSALSVLSVDKLCGNAQSLDTVLKLEDLRCSERVREASSATPHVPSIPAGPEAPSEPEPPAIPPVKGARDGPAPPWPSDQSTPLTIDAPDDTPLPPHPQPSQSSGTTAPPPVAMVTNVPPAPQAEPVRQLVNDELFRMVQLQQINFMSLMHMVGSTFASLPYMQLAQSNTLLSHRSAAQPAPFPPSQPNTFFPPVHANTYEQLQTGAGVPLCSERSDVLPNLASTYNISAGPEPDRRPDQPSTSRNHPGNIDSAEPSTVQAEPPGSPPGESRRLTQTSQGLQTTHDRQKPLPSVPAPLPSDLDTASHGTPPPLLSVRIRQFLNVVDLEEEEESPLRDPAPRSRPRSQQDIQHPAPSSAQLHLIAASVVSNAAAAGARTSDTPAGEFAEAVPPPDLPDAPLVTSTGDRVTDALLQGRPGPSHTGRAPEPQSPGPLGASTGPLGASPGPRAAHFSSCLTEMDAQLAALQSIADHMETEFVNSRMAVPTVNTLTPVSAQGLDSKMTQSKTVSLFLPDKAWRSPSRANKENLSEGRQRGRRESQTDSSVAKRQSLSLSPLSPNTLSSPRTPTSTKDHKFPETTRMSVDSSLGLSGLSNMTDILGELVREGVVSPSDLEVSHAQAARLHRLQHQQQRQRADWSLRSRAADDRESGNELRTWMRRKRRERQAAYQKQRKEMRQREHLPFASAKPRNITFTYQAAVRKIKEDKEKMVLLEQFNQRTREAWLLVSDLPQATLTVPSAARTGRALSPSSVQPSSAHISASSKPSPKVQSRPSQPLFYPWEQPEEKQRWRSPLENQQRFGLHRPVSTLPKDRLSQVTRRGMISEARGRATPHGPANQDRAPHGEGPIKSPVNRSPSRAASGKMRWRERRDEMEREENEASSSWNTPLEISRRLDVKEPKTGLVGLSEEEEEEEAEEEGAEGMSWLERLSDTDTSNLSKIDWDEIERLVATEEI